MSSPRTPRHGPAPIASFDHDNSDESSPETKQSSQLSDIKEDSSGRVPKLTSQASLQPAAPRIDISRASSSSHHDSRDSSPELALFVEGEEAGAPGHLGFREDGALELRSSTEELAFLENPGDPPPPQVVAPRRHSRKDSQSSEAALLGISGRTSRLSSVGSQCSAHSALSGFSHASKISRLSVVSGMSRSPSPHKMLLETSFCGPKPIETDPEICTTAVEEKMFEIVQIDKTVDARDHREVRTEATVENATARVAPRPAVPAPPPIVTVTVAPPMPAVITPAIESVATPAVIDAEKFEKETKNKARAEERKARSRERREPSQPEVYKSRNRSKDIVRIKLNPDSECEDDDDESEGTLVDDPVRKPATLDLTQRPEATPHRRSPSPSVGVSRKSSFCSLFKSRETIASPDSPSEIKRKKSVNDGRSRSRSRDRSATPSSAGKIKGSVLSLFKTPRKSVTSPMPSPRGSPVVQPSKPIHSRHIPIAPTGEPLKYYEESRDGIIHIPLRTPPDERSPRPASAPQPRCMPEVTTSHTRVVTSPDIQKHMPKPEKPTKRTVLPDGSIIIPLHSPTEKVASIEVEARIETKSVVVTVEPVPVDRRAEDVQTSPELNPIADVTPEDGVDERRKKKERILFTTHVGSREQVFSTQFSITKTPSVTSEISGSFASFPEEEVRPPLLRDTHIAAEPDVIEEVKPKPAEIEISPVVTPQGTRDSSESEPSSDAAIAEDDTEQHKLVVQESFEEELPYVPTTLPQERSLAIPMVPIRDRGDVQVAPVQRPRAASVCRAVPQAAAVPEAAAMQPGDKLKIKIPRKPRPASATATTRPTRARTRRGESASESRKSSWIDFEEMPEQKKQPKRIQTLPTSRDQLVFSYVEPDECRCECHHARHDDDKHAGNSSSSPECETVQLNVQIARPFTADLDLQTDGATGKDTSPGSARSQ